MRYIVDIDNTICDSPTSDYSKSTPYMDRIAKINELYDAGHEVFYWTSRGMSSGIDWAKFTQEQLESWGCRATVLLMKKPMYDVWIDDKAISSHVFFNS
jgi:hypothetical protein